MILKKLLNNAETAIISLILSSKVQIEYRVTRYPLKKSLIFTRSNSFLLFLFFINLLFHQIYYHHWLIGISIIIRNWIKTVIRQNVEILFSLIDLKTNLDIIMKLDLKFEFDIWIKNFIFEYLFKNLRFYNWILKIFNRQFYYGIWNYWFKNLIR